jgi:hypothetical protein
MLSQLGVIFGINIKDIHLIILKKLDRLEGRIAESEGEK